MPLYILNTLWFDINLMSNFGSVSLTSLPLKLSRLPVFCSHNLAAGPHFYYYLLIGFV